MQDEILEKYTVAPPQKKINERKKKFEIEKNKHLEA